MLRFKCASVHSWRSREHFSSFVASLFCRLLPFLRLVVRFCVGGFSFLFRCFSFSASCTRPLVCLRKLGLVLLVLRSSCPLAAVLVGCHSFVCGGSALSHFSLLEVLCDLCSCLVDVQGGALEFWVCLPYCCVCPSLCSRVRAGRCVWGPLPLSMLLHCLSIAFWLEHCALLRFLLDPFHCFSNR